MQTAAIEVYNQWLAEFCAVDTTRLIGLALLACWDIDVAVAQLTKARDNCLRGAIVWTAPPDGESFFDPRYERLWSAAADLCMPALLCCQAFGAALAERGTPGAVVNLSSRAGLRARPGVLAYSAAKAGVVALTQGLAQEFAPLGIRVNAVAPGPIQTGRTAEAAARRVADGDQTAAQWQAAYRARIPLGRALEVDGRRCPPGGSLVIEAGARAAATALEPTRLVHVGPHDPYAPTAGYYGPPEPDGHGVHVVGPGGTWAASEPGRDTRMFADSTCPTCRITFFLTSRQQTYVAQPHRHSAEEILYVLAGDVYFGAHQLGPGDAVAVAANQRYGFRSGPAGFAFLNYRRDASEQRVGDGPPLLEGGAARGLTPVHDLR